MQTSPQDVKHDLSHVYWIGGSACAGKTTIADILAKDHGFTVYHCEEHGYEHFERAMAAGTPAVDRIKFHRLEKVILHSPREFIDDSMAWAEEDFKMVLDDLYAMPKEKTVVEGALLPEYVHEIADPRQMIFMIAFEGSQREHFLELDQWKVWQQRIEDPEGVFFENLITIFDFVSRAVHESATELGLKVMITDDESTIAGSVELVREHFRL